MQPNITSAADPKGQTVDSPQLGNTQDVALRYWLDQHGLKTSVSGKGDVNIESTDNATILQQFKAKQIAGAWMPEPWVSRMVTEGGGKVLVNEASLWPKGQFVTTQLIVRTQYLKDHPEQVKELLEGQVDTNAWIATHENQAKADMLRARVAHRQGARPGSAQPEAPDQITVTNDPIASSLLVSAQHGVAVGVSKPARPPRHLRPHAAQPDPRRRPQADGVRRRVRARDELAHERPDEQHGDAGRRGGRA